MPEPSLPRATGSPHLAFLDCIRGYAIFMVIACHAVYDFAGLPYPIKRVAVLGWFGVQLFFLASAVTLLMSWNSHRRAGKNDLRAFALRRFFRIAPAYYCAAVLYYVLLPPPHANVWSVIAGVSFLNSWHPELLIGPDAWIIVPGGWSISVEMTFYLVFPIFATLIRGLWSALITVIVTLLVGTCANLLLISALGNRYPSDALSNYLFFWFPNQASIFAIGALVYYVIPIMPKLGLSRRSSPIIAASSILAFCSLGFIPTGHFLGDYGLTAGHVAAAILAVFVLALSYNGGSFVNRPIAALGRVSFSAYLLHFAVLRLIHVFPGLFQPDAVGVRAILAYGVGISFATVATYLLAALSVRFLEAPMIRVGQTLIAKLPKRQGSMISATNL